MTDHIITRDRIFFLLSGACFVMLFTGGPHIFNSRSFQLAWNLGHIPIFFLWTRMLLRWWPGIGEIPFRHQLFRVMAIALFVSILIELAQRFMGRYADIDDVVKNLLGALLALTLFPPAQVKHPVKGRKVLRIVAIIWLLWAVWPFTKTVSDEIIAQMQFPLLGGFETPFERGRWYGTARLTRDPTIASEGKASLKIAMNTAIYSGASLKHFPGDWRGYRYLAFSVYNPDDSPLEMTCRVNDALHRRLDYRYEDRFNKIYTVKKGWNFIQIPLADIENAPRDRQMNLHEIVDFSIFAIQLPAPRTVYLDDMRLIK